MRVTTVIDHVSASCATQCIADELADRDRRKKNVVICNLTEAKDKEADKLSASSLVETAYGLVPNY